LRNGVVLYAWLAVSFALSFGEHFRAALDRGDGGIFEDDIQRVDSAQKTPDGLGVLVCVEGTVAGDDRPRRFAVSFPLAYLATHQDLNPPRNYENLKGETYSNQDVFEARLDRMYVQETCPPEGQGPAVPVATVAWSSPDGEDMRKSLRPQPGSSETIYVIVPEDASLNRIERLFYTSAEPAFNGLHTMAFRTGSLEKPAELGWYAVAPVALMADAILFPYEVVTSVRERRKPQTP